MLLWQTELLLRTAKGFTHSLVNHGHLSMYSKSKCSSKEDWACEWGRQGYERAGRSANQDPIPIFPSLASLSFLGLRLAK